MTPAARVKAAKPVIVDVGANKGDTVAHFHRDFFQRRRFWALEPTPRPSTAMARRFAGLPQVHPHQLALSSRSGKAIMASYTNAAINSLSRGGGGCFQGSGRRRRRGLPDGRSGAPVLDGILRDSEEIDHIDILKLDTRK